MQEKIAPQRNGVNGHFDLSSRVPTSHTRLLGLEVRHVELSIQHPDGPAAILTTHSPAPGHPC